jgi:cytoskeletal protein RodZ
VYELCPYLSRKIVLHDYFFSTSFPSPFLAGLEKIGQQLTFGTLPKATVSVLPTRVIVNSLPAPSQEEVAYRTEKHTRERQQYLIQKIGLLVLAIYTLFTGIQTYLTRQVIVNNRDSFDKTLREMKEANDNNAISAGDTLIKMQAQTRAQQQAANAAQKSANAAINSVQITKASLRANIDFAPDVPDFARKTVTIHVNNTGKITSGEIEAVLHEATVAVPVPYGSIDLGKTIECHWKREYFHSAAVGNQYNVTVPIPEASESGLTSGTQAVVIAGYVTYNDGFREDGNETNPFCARTVFHVIAKQLFLTPCNGKDVIPKMEKVDGYPNNEQHD